MTTTDMNDATLSAMCRDVAQHLGPPWRLDTSTERQGRDPLVLSGPDGAQLVLGFDDWARPGRVEISGEYPVKNPRNHAIARHEITVAHHRGARVIAVEITRRLLPVYLPDLRRAQDVVSRKAREKQAREHTAAQVAAVLPGTRLTEDDARGSLSCTIGLNLPGGQGGTINLHHDGQHASVSLDGIPAETLPSLVATLCAPISGSSDDPQKGV